MLAGDDIIERPSDAYINVSVSIPGVPDSTIYTNAKITETNTLQNHDITFIGDNMTFSKIPFDTLVQSLYHIDILITLDVHAFRGKLWDI